jgi:ABC-type amino acid transport substrate-binding protein
MLIRALGLAAALLTGTAMPAQALTLGSAELAAAERLGCVLADDALGYLNEEQFNQRFDAAVADFSDAQVDVIYAKALGYIDGLLFGVPSGQADVAAERLENFSNSGRCEGGLRAVSRTVAL